MNKKMKWVATTEEKSSIHLEHETTQVWSSEAPEALPQDGGCCSFLPRPKFHSVKLPHGLLLLPLGLAFLSETQPQLLSVCVWRHLESQGQDLLSPTLMYFFLYLWFFIGFAPSFSVNFTMTWGHSFSRGTGGLFSNTHVRRKLLWGVSTNVNF